MIRRTMKIQFLSFPGCPNADAARQALRGALEAHSFPPHFEEIDLTAESTQYELRAWGSPTILIDGVDVSGERQPAGVSCRLYESASPFLRGVPTEDLIRKAIEAARPRRREWIRSLALIPGAVLPLLPAASCPACLTAYAGVLSAVGLGFLLTDQVLKPLIISFLLIGIAGVGFSTLSHRRPGPLVFTLIGSAAVAVGRLFWSAPPVLYAGVALLIGASLWNLWLKRPRPEPLMQIRATRKEGITS